jgi:hypothetical protein
MSETKPWEGLPDIADVRERVRKFQALELPGQPMGMHMGTAYLVQDLDRLAAAIPSMLEEMVRLRDLEAKLRRDKEQLIDIASREMASLRARITEIERERDDAREAGKMITSALLAQIDENDVQ